MTVHELIQRLLAIPNQESEVEVFYKHMNDVHLKAESAIICANDEYIHIKEKE